MNPACRPITLTAATPPSAADASTLAAWIVRAASPNAVPKPKLCPTYGRSLPIVLGMPTTAMCRPRWAITWVRE